jgi:hypothetical protein
LDVAMKNFLLFSHEPSRLSDRTRVTRFGATPVFYHPRRPTVKKLA